MNKKRIYLIDVGKIRGRRYAAYHLEGDKLVHFWPDLEKGVNPDSVYQKYGFTRQSNDGNTPRYFFSPDADGFERMHSVAKKIAEKYLPHTAISGEVIFYHVQGMFPSPVLKTTIEPKN
jgi:hypothetical protein